jgi:hypothetical protein
MEISAPGGYTVQAQLIGTGAGNCLLVSVSFVSINLNGFEISNAAVGINASGVSDVSVRSPTSGFITGTTTAAIWLGDNGMVELIHTDGNMGDGIRCGTNCVIKSNPANGNVGQGISVGVPPPGAPGATAAVGRCIIHRNIANSNGALGINATDGCAVTGNVASGNSTSGIRCGEECRIAYNETDNNMGDGILAGSTVLAEANYGVDNTMWGLEISSLPTSATRTPVSRSRSHSGYLENVWAGNGSGSVSGGVNLGHNWCNGNPCPP